jgi:hypothetical protein
MVGWWGSGASEDEETARNADWERLRPPLPPIGRRGGAGVATAR